MEDEQENWNERYKRGSHASLEPDPFLVRAYQDFVEPLFSRPGRALDVAGGVGRHAIWLAQRGWQVNLVDISEVGVGEARKNAEERGVTGVELGVRDLKKSPPDPESYDLVLVFFYLERELFPALLAALRPGGVLIYKTYTVEQRKFSGGPTHPMHLLKPNELLHVFAQLRVLHYRETIRERGVAEFVGVRSLM
jgi:tellurite methyltransferase